MMYSDPSVSSLGKCASKSSVRDTFICGISASGESFTPHLQFSTKAKEKERNNPLLDFPINGKSPGQAWV